MPVLHNGGLFENIRNEIFQAQNLPFLLREFIQNFSENKIQEIRINRV